MICRPETASLVGGRAYDLSKGRPALIRRGETCTSSQIKCANIRRLLVFAEFSLSTLRRTCWFVLLTPLLSLSTLRRTCWFVLLTPLLFNYDHFSFSHFSLLFWSVEKILDIYSSADHHWRSPHNLPRTIRWMLWVDPSPSLDQL
jgi:hypothetical protein